MPDIMCNVCLFLKKHSVVIYATLMSNLYCTLVFEESLLCSDSSW